MSADRSAAARAVLGGGDRGARRATAVRPRIQAYLPDEKTDERIRNAFAHEGARHGYSSLGDLIGKVLLAEIEKWERESNNGEPFPDPGYGGVTVTTGRPLRVGPREA